MARTPILFRLLLDALDEFEHAINHIPAPGRGGPLGPLNMSGWVVGHVAQVQDRWLTFASATGAENPWCAEWIRRQRGEVPYGTLVTHLDEATEAFRQVRARAQAFLDGLDPAVLVQPANLAGTHWAASGATVGYQLARSVAHAYVHAGELTVIASLAGAGDLGLPGDLSRTHEGIDGDDPTSTTVAALLRDGYVELRRVFDTTPLPSLTGAIVTLNPGSHSVVHTLAREDRYWNVAAQGRPADALLGTFDGGAPPRPYPPEDVRAAFDRATDAASTWLGGLDAAALAGTVQPGRTPSPIGVQVARSAVHVFSHSGELQSVSSLSGGASMDLPGALAHTLEASR
ncbi:MAG: DinB family protein [Chloroflexi bacterium]|nr:DinB family protein [Chloroflexota bacterium]MDA1240985.1 DinB family protein [Chloroflexota bacterium]